MGECENLIKILFVCHGNICRSPMAEFIMKYLVKESGQEGNFFISSAAATNDDTGSDIYPNARTELIKHNIPFESRHARKIKRGEYSQWDYIIGMDNENIDDILYIMGGDKDNKVKLLLEFTGENKEVSDPWYTRNFALAYSEIYRGCGALLKYLNQVKE
ncbi:MAG: low molecular weight phosphotyrosine protein phosphatase [Synergistaceae bacterium]|nr:low molecular weight phosphotyrosine protein phosphatase [Synergistaceae bacterium]